MPTETTIRVYVAGEYVSYAVEPEVGEAVADLLEAARNACLTLDEGTRAVWGPLRSAVARMGQVRGCDDRTLSGDADHDLEHDRRALSGNRAETKDALRFEKQDRTAAGRR